MENAPALAAAADSSDPRTGLRAVAALRRLLEQLEALQVDNAREQGWSWQEIAEILGVSRQAVHKKHARRAGFGHHGIAPAIAVTPVKRHLLLGETRLTLPTGDSVLTESIYMNTYSHNLSVGVITDRI